MKNKKVIVLVALAVMIAASLLALASCGIFGDTTGDVDGKNKEILTAEYNQTHTVYVGDELNSIRDYLTVTYTDKNGHRSYVTEYELTGSIAEGPCKLTVSYKGITTDITVNVSVNDNPQKLSFNYLSGTDSYELSYAPSDSTNLVIPATYKGKAVTSISSNAFRDIDKLESVTMSESVKTINAMCACEAFYYDGTLSDWCDISFEHQFVNPMYKSKTFYIKNGQTGEFDEMKSVEIPESVKKIGNYQFYGLSTAVSVSIPNTVEEIGSYAFYDCKKVTSFTIDKGVKKIGKYAFRGCSSITSVSLPDSVTELGQNAFSNCSALTSVSIGKGITVIDEHVFSECTSLASVKLHDGVTRISSSFWNCAGLTSITLGKGVKVINDGAFHGCTALESVYYNGTIEDWCNIDFDKYSSKHTCTPMLYASKFYLKNADNDDYTRLTSIVIPEGVTTLGRHQFYNFGEFTSLVIPNSVNSLLSDTFYGCYFSESISLPSTALKHVYAAPTVIITGGTTISDNALKDRKKITSVSFPNTLTKIEYRAFYGCTGLTSVEFPDSLVSIGEEAFFNCTGLQSITFGSGLEKTDTWAFRGCSNLTDVYYTGTLADWCGITLDCAPYESSSGRFYLKNAENGKYEELTDLVIPATVSDIGANSFKCFKNITSLTVHENVKSLGDGAFVSCIGLKSVVLPEGVTDIGSKVFNGCSNLETISLPDSLERLGREVFNGCSNLNYNRDKINSWYYDYLGNDSNPYLVLVKTNPRSSYEIKDGTKIIGADAFYNQSGISSITIPASVTFIGQFAFSCPNLTKVYYNGTIEDWCNVTTNCSVFYSLAHIPNDNHFYIKNGESGYSEVVDLIIPETVTKIGNYQFADFNNVKSAMLPESIASIGEKAFLHCGKLASVNIPDAVTEIRESTFDGCSDLVNVTMSKNITSIDKRAFYGCSSLASIQVPECLENIGDRAFYECADTIYNVYENASYLGNDDNPYLILVSATDNTTKIHETTKIILTSAFANTKINSIVIPDSVEKICDRAFYNCKSLTSITIGKGVKNIGDEAFYGSGITKVYYNGTIGDWCDIVFGSVIFSSSKNNSFYLKNSDGEGYTEITEIVISDDVTEIMAYQFFAFNNITKITIGKNVKSIGAQAFGYCKKLSMIVFDGTVAEWKAISQSTWVIESSAIIVTCSDGNVVLQ